MPSRQDHMKDLKGDSLRRADIFDLGLALAPEVYLPLDHLPLMTATTRAWQGCAKLLLKSCFEHG